MEARHLIITGLVQGVGFRYHMTAFAQQIGAKGWVRNRHDGSVEALVVGDDETVATMLAWARKGPPAARVSEVFVEHAEQSGNLDGFVQRESV